MIQKPFKNEAKTVPRGLHNSGRPRSWWVLAAKRPQEASKTAQEAAKTAQDGPRRPQDGPRRPKLASKMEPKSKKNRWKNRSKMWCVLGLIFGRILLDFWRKKNNRRKMDGKIDRKSNASWSRFLEGQTVSKSWKIEKKSSYLRDSQLKGT